MMVLNALKGTIKIPLFGTKLRQSQVGDFVAEL